MRLRLILSGLLITSGVLFSFAQTPLTSSVSGIVRDNVSRKELEGATILLASQADSLTAFSDARGRFQINNVVPGRYICSISIIGYESDLQESLVITGKETKIEFFLNEGATQLDEVTIDARAAGGTEPGSISIPIEKVMRMPANFFDPVRMLTSYPGVVGTNDQANNIIVKGNSPTGLLWRLNGMDIVNPNHLANAGTFNDKPTANGGGVNILSAQMLDHTDFYSGIMPTRYGNFTSAALDMTLREGNKTKPEYTAQASLIGLDFAAEGPIGKKKRVSYLANYRYSTVGLLSQAGIDFGGEAINFQDFSFNINAQIGNRGGSLSTFGFGGISSNDFNAKDSTEWEVDKDRFTINYRNNTFAVGTRLDLPISESFNFSTGITVSRNDQNRSARTPVFSNRYPYEFNLYESARTLTSAFASITGRLSPNISGEAGVMFNHYDDKLVSSEALRNIGFTLAGYAQPNLVQPYAQANFRAGKFSVDAGIRYLRQSNNLPYNVPAVVTQSVDPRITLKYQLTPSSNIWITGGRTSQMLAPGIYMLQQNSSVFDFLKKQFVEVGHMVQLNKWKLNSSVYYHYYNDVPVSQSGLFSALNYVEGAETRTLLTEGTGSNQGVTVQAERSFVSGFYLLTGASVYKSVYAGLDGIDHPTKFDGKYSLLVTGGKEWMKQSGSAHRSFGIHGRMMYLGGLRDTPINEETSRNSGATTYTTDFNSITLRDYVRFDLRLSWRKDKVKYTRTIALDVQNVAGIKNEAYRYFDVFQDKVVTQYQVGFIPVLVYRIDF